MYKNSPLQCNNCNHYEENKNYKGEGECNIDGRYTRNHRVCNLLDTDEKRRNANKMNISDECNTELVKQSDYIHDCVESVCDNYEPVSGFYLGMTRPKCNRPFRNVKQTAR
jgi:hypothetical protein